MEETALPETKLEQRVPSADLQSHEWQLTDLS
jgi:hypothetical protein